MAWPLFPLRPWGRDYDLRYAPGITDATVIQPTSSSIHPGDLPQQLPLFALGGYESLHPLAGEDFARVDVAAAVHGDHVQAEELPADVGFENANFFDA